MPSLGAAFPAIFVAAKLQVMAPVLQLGPCMAGCPLQAAA
jgi:hypothetical protein